MVRIGKIQIVLAGVLLLLNFSCGKKTPETPARETATVTDVDGNVYKTVKIGNQWWMAENLKVTKYRNGYSISYVKVDTNSIWKSITTGAYCRFDPTNVNIHPPGFLYNMYAVNDTSHLAPAGWHIPSDNEWKELEKYLGMSQTDADRTGWRGKDEGDKLKIQAPTGWTTFGDVWGTNESGFTAIAGSCTLFNGAPGDPGISATGFWWSSTSAPDNTAWYRYLDYKNSNIFRSYTKKNYGFSVRCVKD